MPAIASSPKDQSRPEGTTQAADRYDVIAKAYETALSPEEYDSFVQQWSEYLVARDSELPPEISSEPPTEDAIIDPELDSHFNRAVEMLKRLETNERAQSPSDLIEGEERLTVVISLSGHILESNAKPGQLFSSAKTIEDLAASFRAEDFQRLRDSLSRADRIGTTLPPTVVTADPGDGTLSHFAVVPTAIATDGDVFLVIRALAPNWSDDLQSVLKTVFDLTNREYEIVRYLCRNDSVADIAKRDGRSVHTIRTQMKTVLSKTGASSQASLVRIVSGISTLAVPGFGEKHQAVDTGRREDLELPDGRWMELHLHGPQTGRPVIFVHGMLDGISIAPLVTRDLFARNIRIIAPVRASFGRSDPLKDAKTAPQKFVDDLSFIMGHLKVETAPIIGHMAGSVYAFAAATELPDRVNAIINVSGGVPIKTRKQFLMMTMRQRIMALTARYTPSLMPVFVNAGIAQIKSGMEQKFMTALYKDAPHDLEVAKRPDIFPLLRDGYRFSVEQGDNAFLTDAIHVTRDWSELVDNVEQPVHLVHGVHDPVVHIETVRNFASQYSNMRLHEHGDAGQLLFHERPERVLDLVQEVLANADGDARPLAAEAAQL